MRIAHLRHARGLTQAQLAALADVEQATISRIENGDEGVTLRTLKRCAEALDVSLAEIFLDERGAEELEVLRAYRQLSPERRQGWSDMARALLACASEPTQKSA